MRTRTRDNSVVRLQDVAAIHAGGFSIDLQNGSVAHENADYQRDVLLRNTDRSFFIDEPHRPRSDAFGEANRWTELIEPLSDEFLVWDGRFNYGGRDLTNISYSNYGNYMRTFTPWQFFKNCIEDEVLCGPWPYRTRGRMSLNNAVQAQRNRMFAYKGGVAETIGELPECPALFKLVSASRSIRQNVTGLALGIRFGWMPLASTVVDAFHEVSRWKTALFKKRMGIQTLRFSGPDDWDFTRFQPPKKTASDGVSYGDSHYLNLVSHKGKITYMARVNMRPYYDGDLWGIFSKLASLGAIPSMRTAWELLPRSFIIDWFVSVGDIISSIQGNLLYDIDILEQAWSWRIQDRLEYRWQTPKQDQLLWNGTFDAFYRSSNPPAHGWAVPRVRMPTDIGKISSLALLVAQALPIKGERSIRAIASSLRRKGYR